MNKLDKLLTLNRIIILDGSFDFQLNYHLEKNLDDDFLWSARALVSDSEAVINVHKDYIKAGADIIETNSYQASEKGFMKYMQMNRDDSYKLIKKSVELAKTAIQQCESENILKGRDYPLIAGLIGPYGAFLHDGSEYNGRYTDLVTTEELKDYHEPRLSALIEGGVDLLAFETIPSRKEAELLCEMITQYPDIKAWLSFSCKDDGISTAYGDNFAETVRLCYEKSRNQLVALGVNCIKPNEVKPLLKLIKDGINKKTPLFVYANSGEKFNISKEWDYITEPIEPYVPDTLDLGIKYIGGCCRVCSNYISTIKEEVNKWETNLNSK